MLIGTKFFPLSTSVNPDYRPSSNPPIKFTASAVAGASVLTGVDPAVVAAINSMNASISGPGVKPNSNAVLSAAGTSITMANPIPVNVNVANFLYWDNSRPAAGVDKAIQAIICTDGANAGIDFYDASGTLVSIPNGVLVQGGVYYFEIGLLDTVTDGAFIGYAPN